MRSDLQCMYKDKERNKFIKGKSLKSKKIYKIKKVQSEEGSNDQHCYEQRHQKCHLIVSRFKPE